MTDIASRKKSLREMTRTALRASSTGRKWIKILLVIGGALIAGGSSALATTLATELQWPLHVTQGIGLVMVFMGGVLMELIDESAADAINCANDLIEIAMQREKDISSLEQDFQWFTRLYSTAGALRDIVEGVVIHGPGSLEEQRSRFGNMLDVVVAEKAILFGIESDRWNFALYLYDPPTEELNCVACRRPIRAEEEAAHRPWKPGQGHVGAAFQMQREIVAGDTSAAEARLLFDSPDASQRDSDRRRYRSIASLPIRLAGEPIVGILVATSDVPQRFRIRQRDEAAMDPVEPLRILASALAFTMKSADLHSRLRGSAKNEPSEN